MTRSTTSLIEAKRPAVRPRGLWAVAVGIGLLALSPLQVSVVRAADDDLSTMIEKAKTSGDHEAIAARYEKQAADAKKEAELHRKMEKSYGVSAAGGAKGGATALPQHCDALAKHYDGLAQEYATLAAAHRDMAKTAK
jgi:hypothetical protein